MTLRLTSHDAHSGLAGFEYGIDEEVKRHSVSSADTTEITFTTPQAGGRSWVYVWARDKAGNSSNRVVFDFFAARFIEATPAAIWRLDGDGLDDSGHGHQLMLGSGIDWNHNSGLPNNSSALELDGTGCISTDGPVVRTDAEYTVAAWVRLDDKSTDQTIIAPAGEIRTGFYFRYHDSFDRWYFGFVDEDSRDPVWASLRSPEAPVLGQWTHVAVRVDPAARHVQMYINGTLASEREIPFIPWNAAGPMYVGCSAALTGRTWFHLDGAVQHVGIWQGLLTPEQIEATYHGQLPAGLTGDWRMRGNGADSSAHVRNLDIPVDAGWVDDPFGRAHSALHLSGTSCAASQEPVLRTDTSYSVSAWAKLDSKTSDQTVISQAGATGPGMRLWYDTAADTWRLTLPPGDGAATPAEVAATSTPTVGEWTHLTAVVEAVDGQSGRLTLYVNGEQEAQTSFGFAPVASTGPLYIGCAAPMSGPTAEHLHGAVTGVTTWRGALTSDQAADVYGGNPAVVALSRWSLNGDSTDDLGNQPLILVGTEGVDYEWVDDPECFPWRALGLQVTGAGHAQTVDPVLDTDESFTVAAWVKLDSAGGYQTVLSQGGATRSGFYLQATPEGSWRFAMPQQDTADPTWASAESAPGLVEVGVWTHLTGVFDLAAGQVRLYVNGELVDVDDSVESPWDADGPFYLGVAGTSAGVAGDRVHGAIDAVEVWSSTLDPDRIAELGRPPLWGCW